MKKMMRRTAAGLLSAAMLCTALPAGTVYAASAEDTLRQMIREAWETRSDRLSISSLRLSFDQVADIYYGMLYTDSEWFYVSSSFTYSQSQWSGKVSTVNPKYNYEKAEIPQMVTDFNAEIDRVTGLVNPDWPDAEKVLFLHDYLAEVCEYDLSYVKSDAYAALLGGTAVCQGYALAMNLLCRKVGIPCVSVTSDDLNHMWNAVKIDGHWYHTDATFDDSAPDMLGHSAHKYMLCSDEYMQADPLHSASDWNYFSGGEAVVCDSDAYEHAFWEGAIDTCEPQPDGTWIYAVAADPTKVQFASQIISDLYRGNAEGKEKLRTLRATWPTPDGSVYTTCYLVTDVYDGKIYYHTDTKIMAIPPEGGDAETVYTLTAEEKTLGSLYGMVISDSGLITYQIMPLPAFESEENYDSKAVFHTYQLPQQAPAVTTTVPETTTTEKVTTTTAKVTTTAKATTTTAKATTTTPKATTTTPKATTTTTKATTTTPKATTTTAKTTTTPKATTTTAKATTTTAKATTTTAKATTTTTKTVTTTTKAAGTTTVPVTTTTETVTTTTTAKKVTVTKRGDLNLDDKVDVSDAVMLARLLVEDKKLAVTEQGMANADCDSDRKITPEDLTWVLRFIAKLI